MTYRYEFSPRINPGILKWKLNEDHMDLLWTYLKKPTTKGAWKFDDNNKIIERTPYQEWALDDYTKRFRSEVLAPAIKEYVDYWGYPMALKTSHYPIPKMNRWWVRVSGKGEYQPLHDHQSIWTFIIWMNIPFEYEDEQSGDAIELYPEAGNVTIHYLDSIGRLQVYPFRLGKKDEGTMLLFPGDLNHTVYPHYTTDEYRISIAGDIVIDSLNCDQLVPVYRKNDHEFSNFREED
tara:strand:+ start:112 stop:816 length:705 start_codon:yes stop_codon:yes gene_type:complete